MRYMGGKFKIRKEVAGFLKILRAPGQAYLEPFVGGEWSINNTVVISEYKAPEDFICVAEFKSRMGHRN